MDAPFPKGMVEEIERFLKTDKTRPNGQDLYREVFDTNLFFPLQRKNELAHMMRIAKTFSPHVVMEIGADKGGGLYHWCKSLPTVKQVIACEVRGLPYQYAFDEAFGDRIQFCWIEGSSYGTDTVKLVKWFLGVTSDKIDCLFIDGDKTKFIEDFDAYLPLMNDRAVVFMHDIQDREPRLAFEQIKKRGYRTDVILDVSESLRAMRDDKNKIPAATPYEGWLRHWKGTSCGVGVIWIDGR